MGTIDRVELGDLTKDSEVIDRDSLCRAISGEAGNLVFGTGLSDEVSSYCLFSENVNFCENEDEVELCKREAPNFQDVFDNWQRLAIYGEHNTTTEAVTVKQYGFTEGWNPNNVNSWSYDATRKTVTNQVNSSEFLGFVSKSKYSEYDITVRLYQEQSSSGDADDYIGIVGAFATDSSGKQHTLTFWRTVNYNNSVQAPNHHWTCLVDSYGDDRHLTVENCPKQGGIFFPENQENGQFMLSSCSGLNKDTECASGSATWFQYGEGVIVNIKRKGNVFKAYSTMAERNKSFQPREIITQGKITEEQVQELVIDQGYGMEIDLDKLIASDEFTDDQKNVLKLFRNESQFGYAAFSQQYVAFQNLNFNTYRRDIVDIQNGKKYVYNNDTLVWEEEECLDPYGQINIGQMSYNELTNKIYVRKNATQFNVIKTSGGQSSSGSTTQEESFVQRLNLFMEGILGE